MDAIQRKIPSLSLQSLCFAHGRSVSLQSCCTDVTSTHASSLVERRPRMTDPTPPSSASRVRPAQVEDAFPTPPRGKIPDPAFCVNGRLSSAPDKFLNMQRAQSTPPELTNDPQLANRRIPGASSAEQSWSQRQLSKRRSQYYSDAFSYREPHNNAKERVVRDSIILAEVNLNCCVSA